MRATGLLLLSLSVAAGRLRGQTEDAPATGTSWAVVALGVTGSALGVVAGVKSADWASRSFNIERGVEDRGSALRAVSGLVGSLAGTMIGTTLGSGVSHRPRVGFTGRLRDAGIGMMLGFGVGLVVAGNAHNQRAGVIAFSVTQGLCAGLSNGRW